AAGGGLLGGTITTNGTFSANFLAPGGDNGGAATVARGDHVHDSRYSTRNELSLPGTINTVTNPVDWTKLKNVPSAITGGPGVEFASVVQTNIDVRTSAVNVGVISMTVPAAGFVVVRFDGNALAAVGDRLVLAASDQSQSWFASEGNVSFNGGGNSDPQPFSHTRVYAVTAGSHTFYAVAQNYVNVGGNGIASVYGMLSA